MSTRAINALRRKLEGAELDHLRKLCLDLHTQLEQVTAERDHMANSADFWHDYAMELQSELWETTDKTVAISQSCRITLIDKEPA